VNTIRTSEAEINKLREDKKHRILLLHPGDLKNIGTRIRELEDQLEDNKLARGALEKEIQEFQEKKEPEALEIRQRLAEKLWPAALAEYEKLPKILGELRSIVGKVIEFNNEAITSRKHHDELVGDAMQTPQLNIPEELYLAANAKLDSAPKSLDLRLATEREEQRLVDLFKEQEPEVTKILKRAGQAWPNCPACGARMLAQRRGPNTPAYGMSEDGKRGFANFRCQKHSQWTRDIVFPPPPPAPGARYPIPEDSAPVQSVFAVPPRNDGHGLAQPGLTSQNNKGGKTK
jgi:hypothetical protein